MSNITLKTTRLTSQYSSPKSYKYQSSHTHKATLKPRCCSLCQQPGHFKNKCPETKNTEAKSQEAKTPETKTSGAKNQQLTQLGQITQLGQLGQPGQLFSNNYTIKKLSNNSHQITPQKIDENSSRPPPTPRTEVQSHGKTWEKDILINIYGAPIDKVNNSNYTQIYDLLAEDNKLESVNLSVKTSGSGSVYMGDCLRIFNSVSSGIPYHLVLIKYIQQDNRKTISGIIEFDLTNAKQILFGELTEEQIIMLRNEIKKIPQRRKPTQAEHQAIYKMRNELQKLSGVISLDIKCNSTQSRLQCSISASRFNELITIHKNRVIAISNNNRFRGGWIRPYLISTRRTFKNKSQKSQETQKSHEINE